MFLLLSQATRASSLHNFGSVLTPVIASRVHAHVAPIVQALAILAPIKDKFGDGLSWADLIVLSGNVALEQAGGNLMTFCGGKALLCFQANWLGF